MMPIRERRTYNPLNLMVLIAWGFGIWAVVSGRMDWTVLVFLVLVCSKLSLR